MEAPVTLASLFALLDTMQRALESEDIERIGQLVGEYKDCINAFIAAPSQALSRYDDMSKLLQAHLRMQDIMTAARDVAAGRMKLFQPHE